MASDSIKGLTVKIGADTSDFIKQLKKVDKEINITNKQANELQKGLQLEFDESRFIEAQRLVQQSLEQTEEKVKAIREQLKYLESTSGVDTESYKKLQTELYKAENNAILLKQKLEDINNVNTNKATSNIKSLITNLKSGSAAAIGVATLLFGIAKKSATAGASIQDLADRLGIASNEIQRYNYIAMQSGVDTEQLVKSMAKARDAIGTALSGTSNTATKTLEKLFGDLGKIPKSTEEGFNAIIEKLSEVKDSTMQAYYANEIFGERLATDLIPLINNGADKLDKLNSEFESLGSLTNDEIQQLADFDDYLNKIGSEIKNLTYNLGVALVPVLEMAFEVLRPFIPILNTITDLITPLVNMVSFVADKINSISLATIGYGWLWGDEESKNKLQNWGDWRGIVDFESGNETLNNYNIPTNNNTISNNNYEDNSTTNIEITQTPTGNLEYDSEELVDAIIKKIVTKKQSGGR